RVEAEALEQVVDELGEAEGAALEGEEERPHLVGAQLTESVAQQLDGGELRGERRAELVRDVREDGVAQPARRLELGLVAHHLELLLALGPGAGVRRAWGGARDHDFAAAPVRGEEALRRARAPEEARVDDRAALLARPTAVRLSRAQDIAAEASDRCPSVEAEHRRGLGIEIADAPLAVDG